jgi:ethanolamine ammonia-lyase large subunit
MDGLMVLLAVAGVNFLIAVPGADDVMLNYQSLSFHDVLALRAMLGLRPAPEFEDWLVRMEIADRQGRIRPPGPEAPRLARLVHYAGGAADAG